MNDLTTGERQNERKLSEYDAAIAANVSGGSWYSVRMTLNIGEYEKHSNAIVLAANEDQACRIALLGECHGDADWSDDDGSYRACWDMGEMAYEVDRVVEVSKAEAKTLRLYL